MKIEINQDFARALNILEGTNKNAFITGKAGTGKSTLLQYFRKKTGKNVAVLAPTGVAALNVKGQTIHSFFRFPTHISPQTVRSQKPSGKLQELLKKLDAIVIDEVSMVRADLMDCIDESLRFYLKNKKPFGGLQMIFIGDLYQLPPVVAGAEEKELFKTYYESPYFFSADALKEFEMEFIELEKIYRQKDPHFIELLNKIRNNSIDEKDVQQLNQRYAPRFEITDKKKFYITLTTTNSAADIINAEKLATLSSKVKKYHGGISGDFDRSHFPTAIELDLKIGAQVMLLNNDSGGRWVNGSVGKIVDVRFDEEAGEDTLIVQLNEGDIVEVSKYTWEVYRYTFNKKSSSLDVESAGSFTQYPIRLAWAVTIHKSQGKTFDNVIVDIGNGAFTHGQVYVAISRCTSFEGLVLKKTIAKKHIWTSYSIVKFLTRYQYKKSDEAMSFDRKVECIESAIGARKMLDITYLKANDTKSRRTIKPTKIGEMSFLGKKFIGIDAYCMTRQEDRVFRVDRILEMKVAG